MWLNGDQRFDNDVFNAMHHGLKINPILFKVSRKLRKVPLGCVLVFVLRVGFVVCIAACFDVLIVVLVHRVIRQVDELLISCCRIRRVLFSRKSGKTLLEKIDFERFEAGH